MFEWVWHNFSPLAFVGPKELTGDVDLVSRYKLVAHRQFYCNRSLPFSLLGEHYLHNIVGDTDIRKGEGMQLVELIRQPPCVNDTNSHTQLFPLDTLWDAFELQESPHVDLSHLSTIVLWVYVQKSISTKVLLLSLLVLLWYSLGWEWSSYCRIKIQE